MSKNTLCSQFRSIDVDKYNKDNYIDEDVEPQTPQTIIDDSTVVNLINAGNPGEALKQLLQSAPASPKGKNETLKEDHHNLVMKVLLSVNKSQMDGIVSKLSMDEQDILMKYIYRGFEKPSEKSSNVLLLWHEKVYSEGGVGCIVRVLTDRKRI